MENLQKQYFDRLNAYLPSVDFTRLDRSCNAQNAQYAKEVLKVLHNLFVEIYQSDYLDSSYGYVDLPAIVRGRETGHLGLALVTISIQDAGDHNGTYFLTPLGVLDDADETLTPSEQCYLSDVYGRYDYWYTIEVPTDTRVEFENLPSKVADLLNYCPLNRPELEL